MSVCIWEFAIFFFPCVLCFFFLFGVHYYPPLAFGFGIYGMQPGIEKHFVHINRLSVSAFTWAGIKFPFRPCQSNQIKSDQIILLSMSYFILYLLYFILEDSL